MEVITLQSLQETFKKNSFQSDCVPQIQIGRYVADVDNETPEEEGWIRRPLGFGGPMAIPLRTNNHLFRNGSSSLQKVLLREAVTDAQNNAASVLKGRRWPIRRVAEALSSCLSSRIPEDQTSAWNDLCYAAVCEMEQIQIIIADTETKTLTFAPEDIRNWNHECPIYIMSKDGRWLFASCKGDTEAWPHSTIGLWLSKMEAAEWKISWPIAEGTMDSMYEILQEAGLAVEGRLKKDDLARRAGRAGAVALLGNWYRTTDNVGSKI